MAGSPRFFDPQTSILQSPRFLLAIALVLTLLSYIAICRFDFVYDDHQQIEGNPAIRTWERLPSYFTSHLWANAANEQSSNYYRPLFLIWLRLNYLVFGTHAAGWHATSLLLHLVATLLVYVAARNLLKMSGMESPQTVAAIAALIFGLHPVHAEPVAWISASSELMVTCFLLGALACYARARMQSGGGKWMARLHTLKSPEAISLITNNRSENVSGHVFLVEAMSFRYLFLNAIAVESRSGNRSKNAKQGTFASAVFQITWFRDYFCNRLDIHWMRQHGIDCYSPKSTEPCNSHDRQYQREWGRNHERDHELDDKRQRHVAS